MNDIEIDVKAIVAKHDGDYRAVRDHVRAEFQSVSNSVAPCVAINEAHRIYGEMLTAIRVHNEHKMNGTLAHSGSAALIPGPKVTPIPGFNPKD